MRMSLEDVMHIETAQAEMSRCAETAVMTASRFRHREKMVGAGAGAMGRRWRQ